MGLGAAARRAQARQEMRDAILATAREMVEAQGVAKLSLRAIARELGYSPAALYEYFPSKEAISRALYFEGTDGLGSRMSRAIAEMPPGTPPREVKKELGRAYRRYALEQRELFLLIFGGAGDFTEGKEPTLEPSGGGYESLIATVQQGIDSGDFVDLPADVIALTSWAAVHGFVMLELAGLFAAKQQGDDCPPEDPLPDPDALFELHLDLIDQGVSRQ